MATCSSDLILEEKRMLSHELKSVSRLLALACMVSIPLALCAQDAATPPAAKAPAGDPASKWDIFAGYSYLEPRGTVNTPVPGGKMIRAAYDNVVNGQIVSASFFFNRYLGVQAEAGVHEWGIQDQNTANYLATGTESNNDGFLSASGGLILRVPVRNFTPFLHALGGETLVDGPVHNPYTWGLSGTGGVGLDYQTRWFHRRLSIRLFQADYEHMHVDFGTQNYGGIANINALRGSVGLVWHSGNPEPREGLSLACTASPVTVYAGDPVSITAMAGGLDPRLSAIYFWSGAGVTGSGETVTVATGGLAPGSYTVDCGVKEGKAGSEGLRRGHTATSSATFTVKVFDAPTVSCTASPSTIAPGESSTITATAVSPQNLPLTYTYAAAAGTVSGTGASAVYSSTGAPTGTTTITCSVSDDKGQTASGSTTVTIMAPYVAPSPHTQALCSISFVKDKARPARVDNEAKACLDDVALNMQRQSDAKVVVVGNASAAEKAMPSHAGKNAVVDNVAARRAVNTKEYLVTEKGIDASRVIVATGTANASSAEDYLVPAGAAYTADLTGIVPVDETVVKPQPRTPLAAPRPARKQAAPPAQ